MKEVGQVGQVGDKSGEDLSNNSVFGIATT